MERKGRERKGKEEKGRERKRKGGKGGKGRGLVRVVFMNSCFVLASFWITDRTPISTKTITEKKRTTKLKSKGKKEG
jgi:hypothetical protein